MCSTLWALPAATQHRRTYAYDEDGLRLVQVDVLNRDDAGPYRLRRQMQYDLLFDRVTLSSEWILVEGDRAVTSSDPTAYGYDAFGRTSSILKPGGDSGASPTLEFEYDLGNPTSRIITRRRSEVGGPTDIETVSCVDGRGRPYQTRRRTSDGEYTVDGFSIFNIRSQLVRSFQSYDSSSAECDIAPPNGTRFTRFRYDGFESARGDHLARQRRARRRLGGAHGVRTTPTAELRRRGQRPCERVSQTRPRCAPWTGWVGWCRSNEGWWASRR